VGDLSHSTRNKVIIDPKGMIAAERQMNKAGDDRPPRAVGVRVRCKERGR
jgi:hypothetical protein